MTTETYVEKINKLLRKAESTTPEEAELLFAKATELMAKYAIDEAMLQAARGTKREKEPLISEEIVCIGIYRFPIGRMSWQVAQTQGCKVIKISDPGWRTVGGKTYKQTEVYMAVGYQSDMENAKMLNASLEIQMMRAETIWWKEHQQLYSHLSHSQQHQARRGFMFAFADAAALKMKEATARGKASAEEQHGRESVALVLRDKSLDVKAEFDRMFPQTRKVKDRKNHGDMFARAAGNEAGRNADVGQAGLGNDRKALNS